MIEGTNVQPDVGQGKITVTLVNTTTKELDRIHDALHRLFEQGVFNVRNGSVSLGFDYAGRLDNIRLEAMKWKQGKSQPIRVAIYEKAIVAVDLKSIQ